MEPLHNSYDLSHQVMRQAALEAAWDRALMLHPTFLLLPADSNSVRDAMDVAIEKAMNGGVCDVDLLIEAAMASMPTPGKHQGR